MSLPGEISQATCNYIEKSAEVIVLTGSEEGTPLMVSQVRKDRTLNML